MKGAVSIALALTLSAGAAPAAITLANGGMEAWDSIFNVGNWVETGSIGQSTDAYEGTYALRLGGYPNTRAGQAFVKFDFDLETTYTFSAWVKVVVAPDTSGGNDGGATLGLAVGPVNSTLFASAAPVTDTNGQWQQLSFDYRPADDPNWGSYGGVALVLITQGNWSDPTQPDNTRPGGEALFDAVTVVPEPATLALLGLGALGLRRRR